MRFLDHARNHIESTLPDIENRLADYIHRSILPEGTNPHSAAWARHLGRDDGFLQDQELNNRPHILLIGSSGSGKTLILTFAYRQAARQFLSDDTAPFPILLNLSDDLGTSQNIERALNNWNQNLFHRSRAEHPSGCALFLDGLDGAIRKSRDFINNLSFFIRDNDDILKQLIVACHRAVWDPDWQKKLPNEIAIYSSDYLDDDSYREILPDRKSLRQFREQCYSLGISALLDTPFNGFYLAREFKDDRPLPQSRRECFDQRIEEMLRGTGSDRNSGRAVPAGRLRFLARQLACIASFSENGM